MPWLGIDDVARFFDDPASEVRTAKPTVDGDHGRIETCTATVSTEIEWLRKTHLAGLEAIGKVERRRETAAKTTTDSRLQEYLRLEALLPLS